MVGWARWWPALVVVAALVGLWLWHGGKVARVVTEAEMAGRRAQAAADTQAFAEAMDMAVADQAAAVAAGVRTAEAITEENRREFANHDDDIDRAADAKLRAQAARDADRRAARQGGADAVPGAAVGDPEAYCAASGWIPFGRALKMATDAEKDANQARQCAAWVSEQAEAWPK